MITALLLGIAAVFWRSTCDEHRLPLHVNAVASPTCRQRRIDEDETEDLSAVRRRPASYSRYSSDLQDERSITDQQRKCRERAERDGFEILPELEFADEAVSGAKHDRDGLEQMLDAAQRGLVSVVYFENLSRLARDSVLTQQTLRVLVHRYKVRIVSIDESIDSSTGDTWEMLAALLGVQNEQYLRSLSKFVLRGQEGVVLDQLCVGDYCFGYSSEPVHGSEGQRKGRHAKPKKRYVVDPEKAIWVRRIFRWFAVELRSLRWIAAELNVHGAPKDHRATVKEWHHQQISTLLKNAKYVGRWQWGARKNVRDPTTGNVRQEPRSPAETEKWLRHFPELQIIDDETFAKAQERLQKFADVAAAVRRRRQDETGRVRSELAGSTSETSKVCPRHLLANLIKCKVCNRTFYVGGGSGAYLFCPGYRMGVCTCGTSLHRARAEKKILDVIGAKILEDAELLQVILDAAHQAWAERERRLPAERASLEKSLAAVERKIERLLNQCEESVVPDLVERLQLRRNERDALRTKLAALDDAEHRQRRQPTDEWLAEQVKDLRSLLVGADPAASIALRQLVGGQIVVHEIRRPGRKRHYLQGEIRVELRDLARSFDALVGDDDRLPAGKSIVIDFREPEDRERLADIVKADFDAGMKIKEIAAKHGCGRALVASALACWHEQRGLPVPDGRSLRGRLSTPRMADERREAIMALWNKDLLIGEIAAEIGCSRPVVHEAVQSWYAEQGLVMPDGRARRREIRLRRQQRRSGPETG